MRMHEGFFFHCPMQFVYTSPRDLIRTQTRTVDVCMCAQLRYQKYNLQCTVANWLTVNCCSDIPIFLFCPIPDRSLCPECCSCYYDYYFVTQKLLQFRQQFLSFSLAHSLSRRCWILHLFDASLRFVFIRSFIILFSLMCCVPFAIYYLICCSLQTQNWVNKICNFNFAFLTI